MNDPKPIPTITEAIEKRFLSFVSKGSSCWLWTGRKNKRAYGVFTIAPRKLMAHRVSYSIFTGEIPDGKFVCHRCDNPPCVNPDHLFVGSRRENIDDMVRKGRWRGPVTAKGEANPSAKLTANNVLKIKNLLIDGGEPSKIARQYGISVEVIRKIRGGNLWQTVGPDMRKCCEPVPIAEIRKRALITRRLNREVRANGDR